MLWTDKSKSCLATVTVWHRPKPAYRRRTSHQLWSTVVEMLWFVVALLPQGLGNLCHISVLRCVWLLVQKLTWRWTFQKDNDFEHTTKWWSLLHFMAYIVPFRPSRIETNELGSRCHGPLHPGSHALYVMRVFVVSTVFCNMSSPHTLTTHSGGKVKYV